MRPGAVLSVVAIWLLIASGTARAQPDLFIGNQGMVGSAGNLAAFTIGAGGALTAFSGSPFPFTGQQGPYGMVVTPDGSTVFVPDGVSAIYPFALGSGSATAEPATDDGAGTVPFVAVDSPDGRRLYAVNNKTATISGYAIGPGGALSPLPSSSYPVSIANPEDAVITPDGAHLYVAGYASSNNKLAAFNVNADGSLSPVTGAPYPLGIQTNGVRMTPNGQYLYATSQDSTTPISIFAVHSDGTLTAISGAPVPGKTLDSPPEIDPTGTRMYVGQADDTILGYAIGATGALTPLPGSPYSGLPPADGFPWALGLTPDGGQLYALYGPATFNTAQHGTIATFDVSANGALTLRAGTVDTGGVGAFQESIAISPDPGPVASIAANGGASGATTTFSAAGSHATLSLYGSLTYNWTFGDGTSATNAGPSPGHVYPSAGTYTVTVTVTDAAGCSVPLVWTGRRAFCSADPSAMAATTVRVAEPAPAMAGVQQSHKRWREGRNLASITAGGRPPVGTIFSFALNEQASVTLTFTHRVERKRRTKTVTAGKLTLAAHAGTDEVFFDGRLARRHQLPPGSYTVTITAINAAGQSSAPVRLRFTIVA